MQVNSMTISKFFSVFYNIERKGFERLDHYALQKLMGHDLVLAKEYYRTIGEKDDYRLNKDNLLGSGKILAIVDSKGKVEYYITPVLEIEPTPIKIDDINANIEDSVVKQNRNRYTKEDIDKLIESGSIGEIATYILYECLNIRKYGYKNVKLIKKELSNRGVSLEKHPAYKRMQKAPAEVVLEREEKEMTYGKYKRRQ